MVKGDARPLISLPWSLSCGWIRGLAMEGKPQKREREPTLLMVYTVDERTLPDLVM